jgi:hypothetical protein
MSFRMTHAGWSSLVVPRRRSSLASGGVCASSRVIAERVWRLRASVLAKDLVRRTRGRRTSHETRVRGGKSRPSSTDSACSENAAPRSTKRVPSLGKCRKFSRHGCDHRDRKWRLFSVVTSRGSIYSPDDLPFREASSFVF